MYYELYILYICSFIYIYIYIYIYTHTHTLFIYLAAMGLRYSM